MSQPDRAQPDSANPDRGKRVDDESRTAGEERARALPDDSPLQPGLPAHTVDPATGEQHTGQ